MAHETAHEHTAEQHVIDTEAGGGGGTATLEASANPFDRTELEQFAADDVTAGAHIGKMLAVMFFYTVIVMSLAGLWTWFATR